MQNISFYIESFKASLVTQRQAYYPGGGAGRCGPRQVCCRRPLPPTNNQLYRPHAPQCGIRNTQGVHGRIKNPVYVDGDSEFGELNDICTI